MQVNLLLLSKSEIYFDLPAGITISIVGNYQAAGNKLFRNQQYQNCLQKSNQLKKIYLQERFSKIYFQERLSNPSIDSSISFEVFLLFFSLDPTDSEFPRFFVSFEDLDCRAAEFTDFKFSEDLGRAPEFSVFTFKLPEDFSLLCGRVSTK